MPEYLISQHDPRGERTEQLAAVKAAHTYTWSTASRWPRG